MTGNTPTSRLLLACPDRPGLIAAVSGFLAEAGLNITDADQHSTARGDSSSAWSSTRRLTTSGRSCIAVSRRRSPGRWRWTTASPSRASASGSRSWSRARITASPICSGAGAAASSAPTSSRSSPITPTTPTRSPRSASPSTTIPVEDGAKAEAEQHMLSLLGGKIDLLVLARYMQVLSADFLRDLEAPAINIHHSFLPAFVGADPYRPRPRARRQADRRHRPLRHRGPRRRPDHRSGRDPGQPPRRGRRPDADRPRHRAPGPRPRRQGPPRRSGPAHGSRTVVF